MLLPWLAGCSALRLGYEQGPTLAYWWLDGYVDFTDAQAPRAKAALQDWFAWHRAGELPDYAERLAALQREAVSPTTPERVCSIVADAQRRATRAFDQAVPALAALVRSLSTAQIAHLEKRYARSNEEAQAEFAQPLPAERRQAAFRRTLDRAETIYGRLDEAQRALLASALAASPFDAERWLAERRARQQDIVRSLREWVGLRTDAAEVQAGLRVFAAHAVRSPRGDYRAYHERLDAANCRLIAQLHNATSPQQRQQAQDKLRGWEDDLRALMRPRVGDARPGS